MIKMRNPTLFFQRTWEEIELETLRKILAIAETERDLAFEDVCLAVGIRGRGWYATNIKGVRDFTQQLVRKARVFALLLKLDPEGELQFD